jgi:pSer/pThr/pTyr-binding forkhead associated (FHA) protein
MPGQGGVGMRPQPPAQQPPPQRQPPPQQPPQQLPPQMPPQAGRGGGSLVAIYEGQQYPVTKEEFIIGRGQKTSDLTIRDSNVSRRHASVVLYNNQYWIVDQQSTNGIEYKGQKIERKVVEDGDSYKICDHEIRFVYR